MKTYLSILGCLALIPTICASPLEANKNQQWSEKKQLTAEEKQQTRINLEDQILELADRQDELSADIQELIEGQTNQEVIKVLEEVEVLMVEVIDHLEEENTGGDTIAIETEIIERIFQSAQKKQQQSSEDDQNKQSSSAMLEMMKQMMGKGQQGPPKQGKPNDQEGKKQAGEGQTGASDISAEAFAGSNSEGNKERRVPSAGGTTKDSLPREFHKAIDAYNKGAEERALQRR